MFRRSFVIFSSCVVLKLCHIVVWCRSCVIFLCQSRVILLCCAIFSCSSCVILMCCVVFVLSCCVVWKLGSGPIPVSPVQEDSRNGARTTPWFSRLCDITHCLDFHRTTGIKPPWKESLNSTSKTFHFFPPHIKRC